MKHTHSQNIFKEPDGYFDDLLERIQKKSDGRKHLALLYRFAAAAVLLIGFSLVVFLPDSISETNFQTQMDQEVELYINSGYWEAEDVLVLSEDPDELLDLIIAEAGSDNPLSEEQMEDENW